MKYLATAKTMQEIDRRTIEEVGIPGLVLMERAALSVVNEICKLVTRDSRILIVVEGGNNGGDGLAAGRILYERGYSPDIYYIGGIPRKSDSFVQQMNIISHMDIPIYDELPIKEYDIIVDAIFGVGLSRDITGIQYEIINKLNYMTGIKLAIDIPSGVNADSGSIMGIGFRADITVTFGLMKVGMVLYPGSDYCGDVRTFDIGFPKEIIRQENISTYTYDCFDLSEVPKRKNDSNKGSYGRVAIIAGSRDISGALSFAAKAAYRTGSGLVKVYTHENNRNIIGNLVPEALIMTYNDDESALLCAEDAIKYGDTLLIGPGIGREGVSYIMVSKVISEYKKTLIIDADGLNILSENTDMLKRRSGSTIITPHLKEMERLCKCSVGDIKKSLVDTCRSFAGEYSCICVLKDARTIVSDGTNDAYINTSGNNGMSTGGSGDVLGGIIAAFIGMGMAPYDAARLGVFVHGLAGDLAYKNKGAYGMMASDIMECIPYVLGGRINGKDL